MDESALLFAAIATGETEKVRRILYRNPKLAAARNSAGLSALLFALYCRNNQMVNLIQRRLPKLDIFEAAALGLVDKLEHQLRMNPALKDALTPDGHSPLQLAELMGREEAAQFLKAI